LAGVTAERGAADDELIKAPVDFTAEKMEKERATYLSWGAVLNRPPCVNTASRIPSGRPTRLASAIHARMCTVHMRLEIAPQTRWNMRVLLFTTTDSINSFDTTTHTLPDGNVFDNETHRDHDWSAPIPEPWYHSRTQPIPDPMSKVSHGSLLLKRFTVLTQRHYKIENNRMSWKTRDQVMWKRFGRDGYFRYNADIQSLPFPALHDPLAANIGLYLMVVAWPTPEDGLTKMKILYQPGADYDQFEDVNPANPKFRGRKGHPAWKAAAAEEPIPRFGYVSSESSEDEDDEDMEEEPDTQELSEALEKHHVEDEHHTPRASGSKRPLGSPIRLRPKKKRQREVSGPVPRTPDVRALHYRDRAKGTKARNRGRTLHRLAGDDDAEDEPEEMGGYILPVRKIPGTGFSMTVSTHLYFVNRMSARNILHHP
jgi:hypothetical protein